jgi:hypothetical protein
VATICTSIAAAIANATRTARAPLTWDPTNHILSRFAFGATVEDHTAITAAGIQTWVNNQIGYGTIYAGYGGNADVAAQGPLLLQSPWQVYQSLGGAAGFGAMDQLSRVTLGLQAWSKAQLYETLVDFFSNHLNVANHKIELWNTRADYDRVVIRPNAMGSFTDMLKASARHPAMLLYLNLAESTKSNVNENYGRELLELHSVGLVYSESDVKQAAKLLTGRTTDQYWRYVYNPANHYVGPVTVLGFTHANSTAEGGEAAADALITYLAKHPATANRLALKMCMRFVSDQPSSTLVAAVAKAYLDGGTKILPMVQTILCSDEFWSSRGMKLRRPAENLLATVRVLGSKPSDMGAALKSLQLLSLSVGDSPLDWIDPDGYPDLADSWSSTGALLGAWVQHRGFAADWYPGFAVWDKTPLYGGTPTTSGAGITMLTRRLTGMTFSTEHQAALQTFVGEPAGTPFASSRLLNLQVPVIALILDAPHHALR